MKAIVTLDDLDIARGQVLPETTPVRLGWGNTWYELDLNESHATSLWAMIAPYIEAGRRSKDAAPKELPAGSDVRKERGVLLYHAVGVPYRVYLSSLRKWAEAHGREISIRESASGIKSYDYQPEHYRDYEAYLTSLDRAQAAG